MRDIVLLEAIGMKVVVVHGGGKAITARLKELNIETKFVTLACAAVRVVVSARTVLFIEELDQTV